VALGTDRHQNYQLFTRARVFRALNTCNHRTGSQISPCSLWDFSHTAAQVPFSRSEEYQTEGSCVLSLMAKEAEAGSLDCLGTVVGERSFTSDTISASPGCSSKCMYLCFTGRCCTESVLVLVQYIHLAPLKRKIKC